MAPEAWCELTLVISMCVKATGKKLVGQEARLWEAVHPFFYADIYPTIKDLLNKAVFTYDFFWKNVIFKVHEFGTFHGCVEVKSLMSMVRKRAPSVKILS